jgi:hypothetical protein
MVEASYLRENNRNNWEVALDFCGSDVLVPLFEADFFRLRCVR